jgi:hypothetical protein
MGVGGQRHAPAALTRERTGTHCIGGWVTPRAGLDGCGKSRPHQSGKVGTQYCISSCHKRENYAVKAKW